VPVGTFDRKHSRVEVFTLSANNLRSLLELRPCSNILDCYFSSRETYGHSCAGHTKAVRGWITHFQSDKESHKDHA